MIDPFEPKIQWFKRIGNRVFRFDKILVVDDTNANFLTVYIQGATVRISEEWERKEFMKWFSDMADVLSKLKLYDVTKPLDQLLGNW